MNTNRVRSLSFLLAILSWRAAQAGPAIWTGPTTNYTQQVPFDPSQTPPYTDRDVLTPNVALTRASPVSGTGNGGLFNPDDESAYSMAAGGPADTEWADGTLSNALTLHYTNWVSAGGGFPAMGTLVGKQLVAHLISDNVYLSVLFTSFPSGPGFAYTRSTPPVTTPTPAVTITNPVGNAVFAAPASVKIAAAATVSSGTVTNVAFLANSNLLGSVQSAPFTFTAGNLAAGAYALTAVATAAGISATSSTVNVSVVLPVAISNSMPLASAGHFSFAYTANPGLTYVIQDSSNLTSWLPLATNIAGANLVRFTNMMVPNGSQYYRVARLPNP